ncbi:hypothetical protein D6T64_03355 [Cryobacterium melibiosiphilum]|uniref:FtsK domain-containing protein n=1 Tax=Cryobacterium melibiosiphilum TaxID=995039 RepID=A0A3A5MKP0_9MICO|nr:hypothetical protein D6T64_03355 [Cryobacterium melibiosiphilum]
MAAGAIYLITGSAFALLFGFLSPIIAVGSLMDGRRSRRRQGARDTREHAVALGALREIVADRHERLRLAARRRTPGALALLSLPAEAGLWSLPGETMLVSLGRGTVPSGVQLGGARDALDERALRDWAALLPGAPLTTDVGGGLGLIGPPLLTRALARSVIVQLCFALPPDTGSVVVPPGEAWRWAVDLPHASDPGEARRSDYRLLIIDTTLTAHASENATAHASENATAHPSEHATEQMPAQGELPPRGKSPVVGIVERGTAGALFLATVEADLPRGCATVVRVHGPQRAEIVRAPSPGSGIGSGIGSGTGSGTASGMVPGTLCEPELITAEQAAVFARALRDRATASGLSRTPNAIPSVVSFASLLPGSSSETDGGASVVAQPPMSGGLACPVGVTAAGPLMLDLVRQGPHVVVGGTTGSGKSELLVTWVAAMAACFGPDTVTFLLVDFKGGAAFGSLVHLPHCVGMITDLDAVQANRALASLSAELRFRESVLRDAGVRDICELSGPVSSATAPPGTAPPGLPRLVIVIDEFATMLGAFPALHSLFVDIAARGRSLGVHLILCTQRPAGVVRDSLLANCSLRLSLRVNNRADSEAVIGTDAAAGLPASVPGRCLVSTGEGPPELGQIATTTAVDLVALAARRTHGGALPGASPRRPWLDPLPRVLLESDLGRGIDPADTELADAQLADAEPSFRLGLADEPEHQRYRVARYRPEHDGHLLVVGDAGSGKSSLLATLAGQGGVTSRTELVRADIEHLWDALVAATSLIETGPLAEPISETSAERSAEARARDRRLLLMLLDDVDSVYARWSGEHQQAALDMLTGLLRDGPGQGLFVALTAQRLYGGLRGVSAHCRSRLLLSVRDRDDYREAGGLADVFSDTLPPGGGYWQGLRVQLLAAAAGNAQALPGCGAPASPVDPAPILDLERMLRHAPLVVVSGAPARTIAGLRRSVGPEVRLVDLVGTSELGTGASRLEVRDATAGTVIVGDADGWQAQWALLAALRGRATLIFDGCSLADLRQITHRRDLPPPLLAGRSRVWVLSPDGALSRATLPNGASRPLNQ